MSIALVSRFNQLVGALKSGSTSQNAAAAAGTASSRRDFLRKSTTLTLAGGAAALLASSGRTAKGAVTLSDDRLSYHFRSIQDHENEHVAFLVKALGSKARPKPTFHNLVQASMDDFIATSQALENTGVGAYLGALPLISSSDYLSAAGSIALIEARHAGFLNAILGDPITGHASDLTDNETFEDTLTIAEVVTNASPFVRSLNGGPALTFSTKKSRSNDIAILNFALALEYLEADYYNVNVRRFF